MKAIDVVRGSQVKIVAHNITAWLYGQTHKGSSVLCLWKPGEICFGPGWASWSCDVDKILQKGGYNRGWWISHEEEVILISSPNLVSASIKMGTDGLACRLCHNFSAMAVPNRPDGNSFICFSCRQGWIPPECEPPLNRLVDPFITICNIQLAVEAVVASRLIVKKVINYS